jgi:hypothetical protein
VRAETLDEDPRSDVQSDQRDGGDGRANDGILISDGKHHTSIASQWEAICSIAAKFGRSAEILRDAATVIQAIIERRREGKWTSSK